LDQETSNWIPKAKRPLEFVVSASKEHFEKRKRKRALEVQNLDQRPKENSGLLQMGSSVVLTPADYAEMRLVQYSKCSEC
jgi:hypothetical protein